MSAFIVDKAHIDALVSLAVWGPSDGGHWHGLRWVVNPDAHWSDAANSELAEHSNADRIGSMLWRENLASVNGRYPDTLEGGTYPGPNDFEPEQTLSYVWPFRSPRVAAVAGLKAIDCYEYQSCEHAGWADSEAARFCDALRRAVVAALPGYSEAPWCIYSEAGQS